MIYLHYIFQIEAKRSFIISLNEMLFQLIAEQK